jgi:hypothetical protein
MSLKQLKERMSVAATAINGAHIEIMQPKAPVLGSHTAVLNIELGAVSLTHSDAF